MDFDSIKAHLVNLQLQYIKKVTDHSAYCVKMQFNHVCFPERRSEHILMGKWNKKKEERRKKRVSQNTDTNTYILKYT